MFYQCNCTTLHFGGVYAATSVPVVMMIVYVGAFSLPAGWISTPTESVLYFPYRHDKLRINIHELRDEFSLVDNPIIL